MNERSITLPRTWSRMGFTAKAGYLCATLKITYEEACSRLAQRAPGQKHKPTAVYSATERTKNYRSPYAED